jgi:AcrR family transcriptional regulator
VTPPTPSGEGIKGQRTRNTIVAHAMEVASIEGLEGLSIGGLATDLEMSKSGLFAHFGSKTDLQMATVTAATAVFVEKVIVPASAEPEGLTRLLGLCLGYLDYSQRRVFPGGCFLFSTTAEMRGRTGPVRDEATDQMNSWLRLLGRNVKVAQSQRELATTVDARGLTFELNAYMTTANWLSVALDDPDAYTSARCAIQRLLAGAGAQPAALRRLEQ